MFNDLRESRGSRCWLCVGKLRAPAAPSHHSGAGRIEPNWLRKGMQITLRERRAQKETQRMYCIPNASLNYKEGPDLQTILINGASLSSWGGANECCIALCWALMEGVLGYRATSCSPTTRARALRPNPRSPVDGPWPLFATATRARPPACARDSRRPATVRK